MLTLNHYVRDEITVMDTCTLLHSLAYVHTCTTVIALVALMQIHILISHSKQLPLGVILKNENVGGEMIEIMEYCHQYVPSKTVDDNSHFIQQLLIGGDQLTCEHVVNLKGTEEILPLQRNDWRQ